MMSWRTGLVALTSASVPHDARCTRHARDSSCPDRRAEEPQMNKRELRARVADAASLTGTDRAASVPSPSAAIPIVSDQEERGILSLTGCSELSWRARNTC